MKKKIISVLAFFVCICLLFTGCDSVSSLLSGENETIEYKIENGEATVVSVPNKSTVKKIDIPDEYEGVPVTKIADFAAVNLEYVNEFYIGKNVKEIGVWALENNQHIAEYTVSEENEYFCSVDGVIYTKDMKSVVCFPPAKEGDYAVLYGVETVRTKAFYRCFKVTRVTLPETVKEIQEKAFFRCEQMAENNLPQSLELIGKDAFSYCYGLKEINIPAGVRQIDEYAFYNCTNLLTVNVDAKESDIQLGKKWFPTDNGLDIKELVINWKK